jgi:hypothetical protein
MDEARKLELHTAIPARHGRAMSDDATLRETARELLRAGKLPNRRPNRIWGGPGIGASQCMLCGGAIAPHEVVLEVEFAREDAARAPNPHFHVRCFSALEAELRKLEAASPVAEIPRKDGASR